MLQTLRKAGVVALRRGGSGGVMLAKPASEISMYDVVAAIDQLPRIQRCPLGVEAHQGGLCPLHSRIDSALEEFENMMRNATIEQVIEASKVDRVGCTFPLKNEGLTIDLAAVKPALGKPDSPETES